jgi:hypothetical protein
MRAEDRLQALDNPDERTAIYERLTLAIEMAERNSLDARTVWERELWNHIFTLCGEALCEIGELIEEHELKGGGPASESGDE